MAARRKPEQPRRKRDQVVIDEALLPFMTRPDYFPQNILYCSVNVTLRVEAGGSVTIQPFFLDQEDNKDRQWTAEQLKKNLAAVVIAPVPGFGDQLGVFAVKPIPKKVVLMEYTGAMRKRGGAGAADSEYIMDLTDFRAAYFNHEQLKVVSNRLAEFEEIDEIDGIRIGGVARYVNHCSDPNLVKLLDHTGTRVFFETSRDIAAGEQLSISYGDNFGFSDNMGMTRL
jgi:hypothetical protein